ncbi:DUF397 domain-containing protein [Streptomyces lydicus]|uniref:DUF397 domain-containing protein n=1 Tax=Streptomyces lydicus TaxID=47763 RepID=UPI0037B78C91
MNFHHARWRKSSVSGDSGCVEAALNTALIGVRDTKHHGAGPVLAFSPLAWTSFLQGLHSGDFASDWIDS